MKAASLVDKIKGQDRAVWRVMIDGHWRTFAQIRAALGGEISENSVSARLRDFRKDIYGASTVERRKLAGSVGIYEYRLIPSAAGRFIFGNAPAEVKPKRPPRAVTLRLFE